MRCAEQAVVLATERPDAARGFPTPARGQFAEHAARRLALITGATSAISRSTPDSCTLAWSISRYELNDATGIQARAD
eukprot:8790404-Pyramimonas_sp.AAC.1